MLSNMDKTCEKLAELSVLRNHYIRVEIKVTNQSRSLVSRALGFQWDLPEKQREAINKRAHRIVSAAIKDKEQHADDQVVALALQAPLQVARDMCAPASVQRHVIELDMRKLARSLPVWEWAQEQKGLSDLGLACIIGATGDLSKYRVGGLWKRLGLAPITKDGQTRACSTWRKSGGLTAADWSDQGSNGPKYSPRRRALIYAQVGTQIIGGMGHGRRPMVGEDISSRSDWSYYEKLFVERLRHEAGKNPAHVRPVTKDGKESYSKHAAALAQHYVEKRLLRNLWKAWRRAIEVVDTDSALPAAERSAPRHLQTSPDVPSASIQDGPSFR